jgi:hypothetical protein
MPPDLRISVCSMPFLYRWFADSRGLAAALRAASHA